MKHFLLLTCCLCIFLDAHAIGTVRYGLDLRDHTWYTEVIPTIDSLRKHQSDEAIYKEFEASCRKDLRFDFPGIESDYRMLMNKLSILKNSSFYRPNDHFLHVSMANCVLDMMADTLQKAITAGTVDPKDPTVTYLLNRLYDFDYMIDVPTSNVTKTIGYLKEGRFGYVFHKLCTTYRHISLWFGFGIAALCFFFFRLKNKKCYGK